MLFIAIIIAFCGSASAAEQNNITQSNTNPQIAVNNLATNPVQNNSKVDISSNSSIQNNIQNNQSDTNSQNTTNTSSTQNNIQDPQSDTNPQTTQNVVSNDTNTSYIANEDPAVITFDDGDESAYTIAYQIMKQYGLVGTLYIVPAWIGTPGYLTLAQLTEMHNAGWTIAEPDMSIIHGYKV